MHRADAGQQAGLGVGQVIAGRAAEILNRLADRVQLQISADAGELRRPVAARLDAKGLVVVPEQGALSGHRCGDRVGWYWQGRLLHLCMSVVFIRNLFIILN